MDIIARSSMLISSGSYMKLCVLLVLKKMESLFRNRLFLHMLSSEP